MKRTERGAVLLALMVIAGWNAAGSQKQEAAGAKPVEGCPEIRSLQEEIADQARRLKDWPNLSRYREANEKVGPAAKGEERVVFLGDSITDQWGQPGFGEFFPGKPYINRGISGQTTPQMLIRFRPDVIALGAKAVVILAGTNDIAGNTGPMRIEEIEANIASMGELARAHGMRVVLASVLPVNDYTADEGGKARKRESRRRGGRQKRSGR